MASKKVDNFSKEKEDYQFQVVCMLYLNLKDNKSFKDQVDKILSSKFDSKTSIQMRKILKQENTPVVFLIMLYDNRRLIIFKVFGVVVYFFL